MGIPLPFPFPLLFSSHTVDPTHSHSHHVHSHQQPLPLLQPFSQLRLHQGSNERRSFMRNGAALISFTFSEAWTGLTVLTITDSLLFRLGKLVYYKLQPLRKILVIRLASHPLHHVPCSLPITLSFISY